MDPVNAKYGRCVTVRFPEAELNFLDTVCADRQMTRSEVIRTAIPSLVFLAHLKGLLDEFHHATPIGDQSMLTTENIVGQDGKVV